MKDNFDPFFNTHRHELDTAEPQREALWNGIEARLNHKQTQKRLALWRVVAVLLALLATGQFAYMLWQERPLAQHYAHAPQKEDEGAFEKLEASYQTEVESLQKKVAAKQIDRSQYAVLLEELAYVDEIENEFEQDIPLTNDREKLAAILIDTYEKKILLLERLLLQIDRDEKQKEKMKKNWVPLNNSNKSLSL